MNLYEVVAENEESYRNYEQFMTERIDFNCDLRDRFKFLEMLRKDSEIIEECINEEEINKKYNFDVLDTFQKDIVSLYSSKIEIEKIYYKNKELYDNFCETVRKLMDTDFELVEIREALLKKTESYHTFLKLPELKKQMDTINNEFIVMKKYIKNLNFLTNPCICSICMENQIQFYINPCGHTLCESCKIKTQISKNCHYCRTKKTEVRSLYL